VREIIRVPCVAFSGFTHKANPEHAKNKMETKQIKLDKNGDMTNVLCRLCGKIIWSNAVWNKDQDAVYHEACNAELEADLLAKQD